MLNEKKSEKTSFRFNSELLERFRVRCVQRGNMQQSDAIEEAVGLWLSQSRDGAANGTHRPTPASPKTDSLNGASGKYAPWVNRLIAVLESKNEIVIEAIQKNLIAFCLVAGVSGEFAGGDADSGNLPRQVANAIESAKRADADAQPVIEKHRRNRRDTGRREKGAA